MRKLVNHSNYLEQYKVLMPITDVLPQNKASSNCYC